MATGYGREEVLNQVKKYELDAYLIKPITQSMLLDTLMNCLDIEFGNAGRHIHNSMKVEVGGIDNISGAKILLVEDNEINQSLRKIFLKLRI